MKKWLIALIALLLVAFIALGAFLLIRLLSSKDGDSEKLDAAEIEAYAAEHWPQYSASFDADAQTLRLSKETLLSYEEACLIGGKVYSDSTAPESYQDDVFSITADLLTQFDVSSLRVELSFLSTEGTPIFTVDSSGTIEICWE